MRKKRYGKLIGVMVSEEIFDLLTKITDEQQVAISKFIRELILKKIGQSEEPAPNPLKTVGSPINHEEEHNHDD